MDFALSNICSDWRLGNGELQLYVMPASAEHKQETLWVGCQLSPQCLMLQKVSRELQKTDQWRLVLPTPAVDWSLLLAPRLGSWGPPGTPTPEDVTLFFHFLRHSHIRKTCSHRCSHIFMNKNKSVSRYSDRNAAFSTLYIFEIIHTIKTKNIGHGY